MVITSCLYYSRLVAQMHSIKAKTNTRRQTACPSLPAAGALCLALLLVLTNACAGSCGQRSQAKDSIEAVLDRQCAAWNRGDLDEFMSGYQRSQDTSYTSGGTEVWGYDSLRDRYQKKYGASRESMGKLRFSNLRVLKLGSKNALVIGHWHLELQNPPALDGIFSLVFVKTGDGWKIMHDHTSVEKKAS
jgi:ketosteroid isomerase-like protein